MRTTHEKKHSLTLISYSFFCVILGFIVNTELVITSKQMGIK